MRHRPRLGELRRFECFDLHLQLLKLQIGVRLQLVQQRVSENADLARAPRMIARLGRWHASWNWSMRAIDNNGSNIKEFIMAGGINDSGIKALVILNAATASSASQEANEAAQKGQELLTKRKQLRGAEAYFERAVGDNMVTEDEYRNIHTMHGELNNNGVDISTFGTDYTTSGLLGGWTDKNGNGTKDVGEWDGAKIDASSEAQHERDNVQKIETMRKNFEGSNKLLDDQGRIDNFQQQQLLATYNEESQKASASQKKLDSVDETFVRNFAG
jgi:hypothetical protein